MTRADAPLPEEIERAISKVVEEFRASDGDEVAWYVANIYRGYWAENFGVFMTVNEIIDGFAELTTASREIVLMSCGAIHKVLSRVDSQSEGVQQMQGVSRTMTASAAQLREKASTNAPVDPSAPLRSSPADVWNNLHGDGGNVEIRNYTGSGHQRPAPTEPPDDGLAF
jgi:hypothetical protein